MSPHEKELLGLCLGVLGTAGLAALGLLLLRWAGVI